MVIVMYVELVICAAVIVVSIVVIVVGGIVIDMSVVTVLHVVGQPYATL